MNIKLLFILCIIGGCAYLIYKIVHKPRPTKASPTPTPTAPNLTPCVQAKSFTLPMLCGISSKPPENFTPSILNIPCENNSDIFYTRLYQPKQIISTPSKGNITYSPLNHSFLFKNDMSCTIIDISHILSEFNYYAYLNETNKPLPNLNLNNILVFTFVFEHKPPSGWTGQFPTNMSNLSLEFKDESPKSFPNLQLLQPSVQIPLIQQYTLSITYYKEPVFPDFTTLKEFNNLNLFFRGPSPESLPTIPDIFKNITLSFYNDCSLQSMNLSVPSDRSISFIFYKNPPSQWPTFTDTGGNISLTFYGSSPSSLPNWINNYNLSITTMRNNGFMPTPGSKCLQLSIQTPIATTQNLKKKECLDSLYCYSSTNCPTSPPNGVCHRSQTPIPISCYCAQITITPIPSVCANIKTPLPSICSITPLPSMIKIPISCPTVIPTRIPIPSVGLNYAGRYA